MQEDLDSPIDAVGGVQEPATGHPTPGPAELEALRRKLAEVEADNAKLRAERRMERTAQLVDELGLSARQALALAQLQSLDDIERKAREFAEAARATTSAQATPAQVPPAPTEPAVDPALASLEGAGETGAAPQAAAASWQEELNRRIAKATSLADVEAIRDEYLRRMGS